MKSFLLSLITFGLSVVLVGCGTNNSVDETSSSNKEIISSENNSSYDTNDKKSELSSDNELKSIKFNYISDISFTYGLQEEQVREFDIESSENTAEVLKILEYVSEDPEVATIEYQESKGLNCCKIKPKSTGQTYVYIRTLDKSVQSDKIKITVKKKEESISVNSSKTTNVSESTTSPKATADSSTSEKEKVSENNAPNSCGKIVYVAPKYGKKYHYDPDCAGKNSTPIDSANAKSRYGPCKKCVE